MKFLIFVLLFIVGCTQQEKKSDVQTVKHHKAATPTLTKTADIENGQKLYVSKSCAACHQIDGTGMNGQLGADFVNDTIVLSRSDEVLFDSIKNGVKKNGKYMPPQKGILNDTEIIDVLAYIRVTFTKKIISE